MAIINGNKTPKHIKTWSQVLTRPELYDACWIMGNIHEIEKMIEQHPVWSLLPIRYYNFGKWEYREKMYFSSFGNYKDGFELCKTADFCSSLGHFAQMLWEKSTEMLTIEYPEITNIVFGNQMDDGIYPITFRYDIEEIAASQRRIMQKLLDDGFSIDEFLRMEYELDQTRNRKTWRYCGVTGYSMEELEHLFYSTEPGEMIPLITRKNVRFSYEECETYYKTFDERMLTLGNQRLAYRFFEPQNHALFEAAISGDKDTIRKLVDSGQNINEIAPCGDTAFSKFLQHLTYYNETHDITEEDEQFLNYLYENGADVDLIGVDVDADPPVLNAFNDHADRLFKWLSDRGADLDVEILYDEWFAKETTHTIRDWIADHENKDDF